MVINMDSYYTQDRLQELWNKINSQHLVYLGMDESMEKMEQRNKLEEYINDYLCMAPHNRKFYLRDTAEVLHRSASTKSDFSGYKAVVAWNAIGRYAGNLLSQPWRKEYRQIKMYSGFYKHQIEGNLVGAEVMFEAMGYKYYSDGILILDGPIDPDRVTQVSQDSIVAYIECQILKSIWEQVSINFTVGWLDVLEFRELHLCAPKQAVQGLNYRFHQRQFQDQRCYAQGSSEQFAVGVPTTNLRYPAATVHHSAPPILPTNHSYPPLASHLHMQPQHTPLCIYPHNGYYTTTTPNYSQCTVPFQYNTTHHPIIKTQYSNGYCYTNGYPSAAASSYTYPVPTGQLIELEHTYDMPDGIGATHQHATSRIADIPSNKNENDYRINNNTDKEEGSGTFESWDYVYKNLESQGYTKDLGERGNILSLSRDKKKSISKSTTDLEEAIANLNVDRPLKMTEGIEKHKQITSKLKDLVDRSNKALTPSSSYDNLSNSTENVAIKKQIPSSTKSSKTLPREKTDVVKHSKASTSKTLDKKSSDKVKANKETKKINGTNINNVNNNSTNNNNNNNNSSSSNGKWNCKTCTYLNNPNVEICEMCYKSKTIVSQDMEVGGSQCPNCTLVNPKSNETCDACNTNLKNSPTYI